MFFFFNDTATTEIYTLSLHDALPIWDHHRGAEDRQDDVAAGKPAARQRECQANPENEGQHGRERGLDHGESQRSEEHTSELQSRQYLVCRLLLEKKKKHANLHAIDLM